MYWPIKEISINKIFLDNKNIRLPIDDKSQEALIRDLFSNENAFEILKSIAQHGIFQDEFPVTIIEHGNYIVIEGNRRIAALQALLDPEKVPTFKEKIKNLKASKIHKIRVAVAPSRSKAMKLIANKHTINLRRGWKPLRQAYFYKSQLDNGKTIEQLIKEYPEHDIPKFIKMLEVHHIAKSIDYDDTDVLLNVHDERKFPISNAERMYTDPYVSDYLGLSFSDTGKIKINATKDSFEKPFKKIIEDISLGKIDSRILNKKEQRKDYIDNFAKDLKPKKTIGTIKSNKFKENKIDAEELRKQRSNRSYKGLIPSFIVYKLKSTPLQKLYKELRTIDVKTYPNASHDLLRTFFECTVITYLKQTNEYDNIPNASNHIPKFSEMLTFLASGNCASFTDSNLKQVINSIKTDYSKPYSLERFNIRNHNENWNSTEDEVRDAWVKLESLMKFLLNPPSKSKK